jgi:hypothetical protein
MKFKNLVFIGNSHISQFLVIKQSYGVISDRLQFPGASIKGLLKENSKIGLSNMINSYDFNNKIAIFVLGQCDIEFGYYYKSVRQNEKLNIDFFMEDLIVKYDKYLSQLSFDFVVVGINPCVSDDIRHNFYVNFEDMDCQDTNQFNETGTVDNNIKFEDYLHIYNDSLFTRNQIHKKFNTLLSKMCFEKGYKFVDIWDDITTNDTIKSQFKLDKLDHHIRESDEIFDFLYKRILREYDIN